MKTYDLPKGAIIKGISVNDELRALTYHKMDGAYGLFTTRDGTIVNIGAMQEREEKDGEYQIV